MTVDKMHLAEFKPLTPRQWERAHKKGGIKIWVSPTMLLKTKQEKSDILTNATMLMKTNGLKSGTHDVDEKKYS